MIYACILHFLTFQIFAVAASANPTNDFQLRLPKGSSLQPPSGMKLQYLALGSGTQHYTCQKDSSTTNALIWKPHGADAILYDISKNSSMAARLVTDFMRGGKSHQTKPDLRAYPILGKHLFVANAAQAGLLLPSFEIKHANIVMTKAGACPSPRNEKRNVDWLQLNTIQGDFAKRAYRTYTRGGKVPSPECKKIDDVINEPYAAIYSFWA